MADHKFITDPFRKPHPRTTNLLGRRFGRLVVIQDAGVYKRSVFWLCKCDCGNIKTVRAYSLKTGDTRSCGCLMQEVNSNLRKQDLTTHGMSKTAIYRRWKGMIQRCYYPKHRSWARYGGRGITVCDEWRSFESFHQDMGDPPSSRHTLERKDPNGPYSKENCYWATPKQQANNCSRNRLVTAFGQTKTVAEWAETVSISQSAIYHRLDNGWPAEEALSVPATHRNTWKRRKSKP